MSLFCFYFTYFYYIRDGFIMATSQRRIGSLNLVYGLLASIISGCNLIIAYFLVPYYLSVTYYGFQLFSILIFIVVILSYMLLNYQNSIMLDCSCFVKSHNCYILNYQSKRYKSNSWVIPNNLDYRVNHNKLLDNDIFIDYLIMLRNFRFFPIIKISLPKDIVELISLFERYSIFNESCLVKQRKLGLRLIQHHINKRIVTVLPNSSNYKFNKKELQSMVRFNNKLANSNYQIHWDYAIKFKAGPFTYVKQ